MSKIIKSDPAAGTDPLMRNAGSYLCSAANGSARKKVLEKIEHSSELQNRQECEKCLLAVWKFQVKSAAQRLLT
jgi:hypothetical protein